MIFHSIIYQLCTYYYFYYVKFCFIYFVISIFLPRFTGEIGLIDEDSHLIFGMKEDSKICCIYSLAFQRCQDTNSTNRFARATRCGFVLRNS